MTNSDQPEGRSVYDDLAAAAVESPDVLEARLTLVGQALVDKQVLGTFTDEELAALDGLTLSPAQPSPWYGSLTDAEKTIALTAALRGLTARGVYLAEPVDPETQTFMPHVEPTILALITMRRYVPHLVVAERKSGDGTDWALVYPQRSSVFLVEYIDRRGLHRFELADGDATLAALTTWCGAADLPAPSLDVTLGRDEIRAKPDALQPVAEALVATILTRFDPQTPEREDWSGVYVGVDGSYVCQPAGEGTRYHGVDRDGVRGHWRVVCG